MEKHWERGVLFLLGGAGYVVLELAWRGMSHWTMFLAGGTALCWLAWLEPGRGPLWAKALCGALGVTALELATGLWCERVLRVRVWDYRAEWADLGGYICPKYSALWLVLSAWVLCAMRLARRWEGRRTARHDGGE